MKLLRDDAADEWTLGRPEGELAVATRERRAIEFDDDLAAAQWLRGFEPEALRRLADEVLDLGVLSRTTDHRLIEGLSGMLVAGQLCAVSGRSNSRGSARDEDWAPTVEQKLVRRLRNTGRNFVFDGDRLRIVDAREWASLNGSDDARYQVVPQAQARELLGRVARQMRLPPDEARAVEEAAALVPALWHPDRTTSGMLLIHIVDRVWNRPRTGADEAAAPTPARGRKTEQEHWFELVLIDDEDKPVPSQLYRIELPGGEIREGRLDAQGKASISGLKSGGNCKVCFPEIDSTEWRAA